MDNNIVEVLINGQKQKIIILYYFTLNSNGKDYIFYRFDSQKFVQKLYTAEIMEIDGNLKAIPIDDINIIKELNSVMEELNNGKI